VDPVILLDREASVIPTGSGARSSVGATVSDSNIGSANSRTGSRLLNDTLAAAVRFASRLVDGLRLSKFFTVYSANALFQSYKKWLLEIKHK
jgi:hypothetical protein